MSAGALDGIRVLEFSQIVAGPVAGIALSDFGADVVKVEPLEGESRRNSGAVVPNEGKYFQSLNRGKRSLTLDLRQPAGQAVVHRLIPHFDVVLSNYRTGVTARLNIDYATLSHINPSLIYSNITGFGDGGPFATRAGSDIVAQAYSGLMAAEAKTDEHGAPVQITGTTIIDRASGLAAAMGICAALFHRERTGEGQEIHISLLHTALELLAPNVMREPVQDANIRDPFLADLTALRDAGVRYDEIAGRRKRQAPRFASHRLYYGGYHTARGGIVLGALTQHNRDTIRGILDMHDDTDAPTFNAAEPENQARIEAWREEIQARLLEHTAEEWAARLVEAGVPASVVNFPEEMSDDPQVEAMGMMTSLDHGITGPQRVVSPIVRMSATPTAISMPSPPLGHHSRAILTEAGYAPGEIDALVAARVISDTA
jgi:crotonobetainyl-CoA:carnitine CoA-transferase CaiB-like acyl-CoA transferase